MEEIIDLIATDSAASDITTKIKDVLFTKSANKTSELSESLLLSIEESNQLEFDFGYEGTDPE